MVFAVVLDFCLCLVILLLLLILAAQRAQIRRVRREMQGHIDGLRLMLNGMERVNREW